MFVSHRRIGSILLVLGAARAIYASEADANAISANIQARHLPFGTILDPINSSPTSNQVIGYTRCGDSALWTGAYLAAESFRYNVTQSPDARANALAAFNGLKSLVDVTGTDVLARCLAPANSPFAQGIESEEASNGVHQNAPYVWIGNTSRDEYVGAMFGLAVAYDFGSGAVPQSSVSALVTRMVSFLMNHGWTITLPDGSITDTFIVRPEEQLMLLEVAAHVNPSQFGTVYHLQEDALSATLPLPVAVDVASNSSYFKFNLDYLAYYTLIRLNNGANNAYNGSYQIVRNYTASHQNAFFDLIDRAIGGLNPARDTEARALLQQWLARPRRDAFVDDSKLVPVCGAEACNPVPVPMRPPTDFLWQRNPFQLSGGGSGIIESAGIDYLLPYWMARFYGVLSAMTVQSAAATSGAVAPDSIASIYGSGLAAGVAQAASQPLPTTLGGVTVTVTDSSGQQLAAPLIYVSPTQINFVIPHGTALGAAGFTVNNGTATQVTTAAIQHVAPTLFSANGTGTGVAAATAQQFQAGNPQAPPANVPVFQCGSSGCSPVPISLGVDTPVILSLYGTGIRNRSTLTDVQANINGIFIPVQYAGPQPTYPGLDQINVPVVLQLRGSGVVNVAVTVDGQVSNTVTIDVQ